MTDEKKYQIHLDNFEGPLDLLLHLIDKNKMDIYDIPIATITAQYLSFLDEARQMDLDIASEFLLMAATLINIKAKMLLPKKKNEDEQEEQDPRAELVQRLLEYKFYKEAAFSLQERETLQSEYMLKPIDIEQMTKDLEPDNPVEHISLQQLFEAFRQVMEATPEEIFTSPIMETILQRDEFYIEEEMTCIRNRLDAEHGLEFVSLFPVGAPKRQIITIFLALLELCKLEEITFKQQGTFTSLWIYEKAISQEDISE